MRDVSHAVRPGRPIESEALAVEDWPRRIARSVLPRWLRERYRAAQVAADASRLMRAAGTETEPRALWNALQSVTRFAPLQREEEIVSLLQRVRDLRPSTVCEIGAAGGGTAFLFGRVARSDATIVSVDLNLTIGLKRAMSIWSQVGQRAVGVTGDSHDRKTFEIVHNLLGDSLDFLFIDGDHTYAGVRQDFYTFSKLVRKGGLIALHDIVPDYGSRHGRPTKAWSGGVPDLWQELKQKYGGEEFVDSYDQNGYGIGTIVWPGGQP
jgi:predicted O-methyltransferase YrrM